MYLLIQPFSVSAMGQTEQLLVDKREGCLLYHFLQVIWVYLCRTITTLLLFPLLPLMWQHLHMRHCPVMRKNASPMVWWESGEHVILEHASRCNPVKRPKCTLSMWIAIQYPYTLTAFFLSFYGTYGAFSSVTRTLWQKVLGSSSDWPVTGWFGCCVCSP